MDGLDQIFEVEPIVIEGLNHAINFGIEFFRQQEVSISSTDKEVKLVTGSEGRERLTRLCSATGMPFPFMNKGRRIDKAEKKYVQVIPAVWKAEKRQKEVPGVNNITKVTERKLWAGEKVIISAGSAKLVKVRTEGDWKGQGFVESIPLEEQETSWKLILPENAYDLSGSVQAVYVENYTEECVEVCVGQRLGIIHSLLIDKAAWLKVELQGGSESEVSDDEEEVTSETINTMQESDYPTEESKRKFIRESFKIDENEMLNRDEKLKEEVIKLFLENFLALALHPNHYGKTDILELKIEQMKDQLDEWIQQGIIEPANSPWASPLVQVKKKDGRTRWVTDLRLLNDVIVKDAYPLTNIQENPQKLKGAKIFSPVDA